MKIFSISLVQDLYNANKTTNEKTANNVNDSWIDLRNAINKKKIPENGNPDKLIDIVEKILGFNKQQKYGWYPSDLTREAIVSDFSRLKFYLIDGLTQHRLIIWRACPMWSEMTVN